MANRNEEKKLNELYDKLVDKVFGSITAVENTEWNKETRTVSAGMQAALSSQYKILRNQCDNRFMDYCNLIKSMLAVYNFGNLESEESLSEQDIDETDAEYIAYAERLAKDKAMMLDGVRNILSHVKNRGYDITPYIDYDGCTEIFGDIETKKITTECTLSATTVFTTLVYFRRAVKRKGLFSDEELKAGGVDLVDEAAKTITDIMIKFVTYIEKNGYTGWGFTFDSTAITLNDTYAVVDAVGRFEDAFEKDQAVDKKKDKEGGRIKDGGKHDGEFLDMIKKHAAAREFPALIERCTAATYKVAYNIYEQTKDVYGQNIFYSGNVVKKRDDSINYSYIATDYEQIGSSSRSSALFNPLYVAMITMYGYNDKELVIHRLMDDYSLVNDLLDRYETNAVEGEKKISEYAYELPWYRVSDDDGESEDDENRGVKTARKFLTEVELLKTAHQSVSHDYTDNERWSGYYRIARVLQKYLEEVRPERLMDITEYRDYLNATKDAIDQVQVCYRKFGNSQRLGIVDTDYVMFSTFDIATDPINISKLNKANIAVNNLRPLLLSSKIMIVSALTKYPQSDMEEMYNAIKNSVHRKTSTRKNSERQPEWLWNEDNVDMNSTARHCEAITYDYFDYYEKYELGLKAVNGLKKSMGADVSKILESKGSFDVADAVAEDDRMYDFKRLVFDITRRNVDIIKDDYRKKLEQKDVQRQDDKRKAEEELERVRAEMRDAIDKKNREIEELKKNFDAQTLAMLHSTTIGETLRGWMREETESYLREMLAMVIINNINGLHSRRVISIESLIGSKGKMLDADFREVASVADKIEDEYGQDPAAAESKYTPKFVRALEMQELFEAAFNGILKMQDIDDLSAATGKDIKTRNADIREVFRESETMLRKNNFYEYTEKLMRAYFALNKKADGGEDK